METLLRGSQSDKFEGRCKNVICQAKQTWEFGAVPQYTKLY